jgi:hypothetical protein
MDSVTHLQWQTLLVAPPPNQLLVLLVLCSVCWGSQPLNALAVAAQLMLT